MAAQAAIPASFAGTWSLDRASSQNVPRMWENATSVTLEITQDKARLVTDFKAEGSQFPSQPLPYNLDGTESTVEMQGRRPGKATLKATVSSDGRTIESSTKRSFTDDQAAQTFVSTSKLSLSDGGKTLTDARHSESPRGPQDSVLVYTRKN